MVRATLISPKEYVGAIMGLCHERRGVSVGMEYISTRRVQLTYDLPLAEIITDFFDALKSRTRGYASFDYESTGYEAADLVKVEVTGLRGAGRRALDHRPPRQGVLPGPGARREAQGAHPAPAVRGAGAGDDG